MKAEPARRFLKSEFHGADKEINRDEHRGRSGPLWWDFPKQGKFARILLSSYDDFADECSYNANAMGQLVAGFPWPACGGKVQFTAKVHRDLAPYVFVAAADDDLYTVYQAMAQPYSWEKIQSQDKKIDLDMFRMLSRLPIALADAGVPLTELWLDCSPLYAGFAQFL